MYQALLSIRGDTCYSQSRCSERKGNKGSPIVTLSLLEQRLGGVLCTILLRTYQSPSLSQRPDLTQTHKAPIKVRSKHETQMQEELKYYCVFAVTLYNLILSLL